MRRPYQKADIFRKQKSKAPRASKEKHTDSLDATTRILCALGIEPKLVGLPFPKPKPNFATGGTVETIYNARPEDFESVAQWYNRIFDKPEPITKNHSKVPSRDEVIGRMMAAQSYSELIGVWKFTFSWNYSLEEYNEIEDAFNELAQSFGRDDTSHGLNTDYLME